MKTCRTCREDLPLESFHRDRTQSDGRKNQCKACAETRRLELTSDPEYRERLRQRNRDFKRNGRDRLYGVQEGTIATLEAQQNGRCAGCGRVANLHVDHDHASGVVRGLLCINCNLTLGHVDDSIERLISLASYLLATENVLEMTS